MNNFYLNRLKTFSVAEFPYRIKQKLISILEEKVFKPKPVGPLQFIPSKKILFPDFAKIATKNNGINIFGKWFDYDNIQPADWHRDIFSGKGFPKSFSKNINIRKDKDISAKVVWEINRLQFLIQIAFKYQNTKDEIHLIQFMKIVTSWKENNPYLVGINWYSNIEVNLRLINWFLCWETLDTDYLMESNESFKRFVLNDWLPIIYQHCIYSYKNPSKYSSANNHLISEYAGLFIAASKWPFNESEKWISYSQKGLETEIIKQHSKNGINKEEAAEYIQFITDFFLLSYIVGENTNHPFSQQFTIQLRSIFDYIYNFLDCKGHFPKYGDEDDGKCFLIDFDKLFNNFKSLLTSGAILFNDPKLKSKSNGLDSKNLFLFGTKGKDLFELIPDISFEEKSIFYAEEGHFIFKEKDNNSEIYLHFDAAPLGFLSIAAHGHADALSFILHLDGQPFFIDPGTYTYHTEPIWRNYFIGTLAHNTIRINKLNQATFAGSTLWLNHYKVEVLKTESNEDYDLVKAQHNGYKNLNIIHRREIILERKNRVIKIIDEIECGKPDSYLIEMPFHMHPLINIDVFNKNQFTLSDSEKTKVVLHTDLRLESRIVFGQTEPKILGWHSNSFMKKEPSNTIICSLEAIGNIKLETLISINPDQ